MGFKRSEITRGFVWRLLERFGAQGVTFIVSIILARLLEPELYGTIALVTVITTILQVFIEGGFGNALIQKKDADDIDFSTVFYFNVSLSIVLYFLIFSFAPLIASFYENKELTSVIRVLSVTIVIYGVKSVQQAYVSRHLQFKRFFFATLIGTLLAAVVGITMAYKGFGIWALVTQHLVNHFVDTLILWFTVKWKPKLVFSWKRFKSLFGYGWKFFASSLIDRLYNESRALIIGKKYSSEDLAFYNRGQQFPNVVVTNVNYSISSVLLPTMSQVQDDKNKVKDMTRKAIKMGSFLTMPAMLGLAACSANIISLLLTDKWLPATPFMIMFCITFSFFPIHTANLNAIKSIGRSDLFLILEIIKKAFGLTVILITMWFGVYWIAAGEVICSIIAQIINSWPNRKLLGYTYFEQLLDLLPNMLTALVMAGL